MTTYLITCYVPSQLKTYKPWETLRNQIEKTFFILHYAGFILCFHGVRRSLLFCRVEKKKTSLLSWMFFLFLKYLKKISYLACCSHVLCMFHVEPPKRARWRASESSDDVTVNTEYVISRSETLTSRGRELILSDLKLFIRRESDNLRKIKSVQGK